MRRRIARFVQGDYGAIMVIITALMVLGMAIFVTFYTDESSAKNSNTCTGWSITSGSQKMRTC